MTYSNNISQLWRRRFQFIYQADKNSQNHYVPNIGFEDGISIYTLLINHKVEADKYSALELGGGVGYSTLWILYGLEDRKSEAASLISVESSRERAIKIISLLEDVDPKKTKWKVLVEDALDYLRKTKEKFDFVFVDIDKGLYIDALTKLNDIINEDSIMLFHNAFIPAPPRDFVKKAVELGFETNVIPTRVGMFLLKKG